MAKFTLLSPQWIERMGYVFILTKHPTRFTRNIHL